MPPNQNVKPLVPWSGVTPLALAQQLLARVEQHKHDGQEHCIIACRAFKNDNGNWSYQPYWSTGPAEVLLMMTHELEWQVMRRERRQLLGLDP